MKNKHQIIIAIGIAFASCNQTASDSTQSFIPGTYVKRIDHEFAKGMDTIQISPFDKDSDTYTVIKKTGYQQTIDGKMLSPKHEIHKWTGMYDKSLKRLEIRHIGKSLSFIPEKNKLLMESSEYIKIKDE